MIRAQQEILGFLIDSTGKSLYEDNTGPAPVLGRQQIPRPLKHLPDGWEDTEVKYGRSSKYRGLQRSYTNQYKFVKDGAFILRNFMYGQQGSESKVFFVIMRWDPDTGIHKLFYRAEIDFTQANDDPLTGVEVNLIEGGATKLITANETTVYEIPCNSTNAAAKVLKLDGVLLNAVANYKLVDSVLDSGEYKATIVLPIAFINIEGDSVGIITGDPSFEIADTGAYEQEDIDAYCATSSNYFFKSANAINPRIISPIHLKKILTGAASLFPSLYRYKVFLQSDMGYHLDLYDAADSNLDININLDETLSLSANEKLFLMVYMEYDFDPDTAPPLPTEKPKIQTFESSLSIKLDTQNPVSDTYVVPVLDVFKQLVSKITNNQYQGESTLLTSYANLFITCGDALRGISTAVIKTTFSDFVTDLMKLLHATLYVDYSTGTVHLLQNESIFDRFTQLMDIGEVTDLSITDAKEFQFANINVGYTGKNNTDNLGKQNFNDKKVFTTPLVKTSNSLDLVLKMQADIFTIEQIRSDYFNKDQTATEKDNDVFIINGVYNEDGDVIPYRPSYSILTGGTNTSSWYNIENLTPGRILRLNGPSIRAGLWAQTAGFLTFQSGERNKELVTQLGPVTIVEKNNIQASNLQAPYYYSKYFKFKTKVPYNLIQLLQAGKGYIKFTYNGVDLYGYPMEVSQKPVYDEPQEWKLLCSVNTNLSDLILLNEVLKIGGNGMISHKLPLKLVPLNATYSAQYHFKHMDIEWHRYRIGRYSQKKPFGQKWQTNDNTPLRFITNGSSMNDVVIYNGKGTIAGTITPTNISNPAVVLPWQLWDVTIDWSLYPPNNTYYALFSFGTGIDKKEFISEPCLLKTEWPDTILIEYSHDTNQTDMIWTGFSSKIRVEAMIHKFEPKSKTSDYEDSRMDVEILDGEPYRGWEFILLQSPDWLADKLNRILLLNNTLFDGYAYVKDKGAQLELVELQGSPYGIWKVPIREKNNRPGIDINASGVNQLELTVEYNLEAIAFSSEDNPNANSQSNLIQITNVE